MNWLKQLWDFIRVSRYTLHLERDLEWLKLQYIQDIQQLRYERDLAQGKCDRMEAALKPETRLWAAPPKHEKTAAEIMRVNTQSWADIQAARLKELEEPEPKEKKHGVRE